MKTKSLIIILLLWNGPVLHSQDSGQPVQHALSLKSKFIQLKDEFNYGLVHNGLNLGVEYTLVSATENTLVVYKAEIDFGASYKQGLGLNGSFKPLDLFYGFRLRGKPEVPVTLGPYVSGYYAWQLYPELQSGTMFWISSYEVGPRLFISIPFKSKTVTFSASGSVAGVNSRPPVKTEAYYYSLTLGDYVRNPHSNMSSGFLNVFNHAEVMVEFGDRNKKRSIYYKFEYLGYLDAPTYQYLSHSLNLKWRIGNHKM